MRRLNGRQARFVSEYLIDGNATQAALRSGYSQRTARAQASRLLTNVGVSATIAARQAEVAERCELTVESHLARLAALSDLAEQAGQYAAAIHAETRRGEVLGFYVKRRADVTKLSESERVSRVKKLLGSA